ncbi:hypothetical protein [Undibacter mobilis]|uniref:Uncharacterized protein n=1 Tax=Undibacter mobilis TaxID=2292256 RepID=A0A371B0V2_9BRAD|nr:hypothetical protein [Undibacter mobilis]RDV01170.1 hypothetical protein DXH78_18215 [Undibacter mobilis]
MSSRHRLLLLLTSAFGAVALLCPIGTRMQPTAVVSPMTSAAPPLFGNDAALAGSDSTVLMALRREATLALGQLQARTAP